MRLLRAAQRHGSGRSRAAHQRCACCMSPSTTIVQHLTTARLREALPNARDLNEAFPAIPPGRVIRCANPSATQADDVEFLLGELRVRDLIDLRAAEEIQEDDPGSALMARMVMRSYRRGWLRPRQLFALPDHGGPSPPAVSASPSALMSGTYGAFAPITADSREGTPAPNSTEDPADPKPAPTQHPAAAASGNPGPNPAAVTTCAEAAVAPAEEVASGAAGGGRGAAAAVAVAAVAAVRHNVSLLDRGRYYLSLVTRIPASTTIAALLTNIVSKHAARALLLPYVNGGGLPMLYEVLLESSKPEMRQVMELLLRAAAARHCAMFFCRAGKDRTGLIAALVLSVAGASDEQIVADYARSDAYHRVALAGLEKREELAGLDRSQFERAPPEVMQATLRYVRRRYGSPSGYLTSIGFGPDRQERLRELLTSQW